MPYLMPARHRYLANSRVIPRVRRQRDPRAANDPCADVARAYKPKQHPLALDLIAGPCQLAFEDHDLGGNHPGWMHLMGESPPPGVRPSSSDRNLVELPDLAQQAKSILGAKGCDHADPNQPHIVLTCHRSERVQCSPQVCSKRSHVSYAARGRRE